MKTTSQNQILSFLLGTVSGLVGLLTLLPVVKSCLILLQLTISLEVLKLIAFLIVVFTAVIVSGSLKKTKLVILKTEVFQFILSGGLSVYLISLPYLTKLAEIAEKYTFLLF